MITITEAIRSYLLADVAIAAQVGGRVYPLKLPQPKAGITQYPAIVLSRISGIRFGHLRGGGSLARPRYQVDCWASTYQSAARLGNLCRRRIDGFAGIWSDDESPDTSVRVSVGFDSEQDLFEEEINGGLFRHSADYFVFHQTAGGAI